MTPFPLVLVRTSRTLSIASANASASSLLLKFSPYTCLREDSCKSKIENAAIENPDAQETLFRQSNAIQGYVPIVTPLMERRSGLIVFKALENGTIYDDLIKQGNAIHECESGGKMSQASNSNYLVILYFSADNPKGTVLYMLVDVNAR